MEYVDLNGRSSRLDRILKPENVHQSMDLVKICGVSGKDMSRIKTALNYFLWICLSEYFKDRTFELSADMLAQYPAEILELPNITPNGLILPKFENQMAYNEVHRVVADSFDKIGMGSSINRIQYPINIRIQSGLGNSEADNRKRSSIKPHTDLWAGDPGAGIMTFLSVLGSVKSAGIEFLKPNKFPISYVRTLDDYSEGKEIAEDSSHLCNLQEQRWFIVDPFVIHRTLKQMPGLRISIDFRFILNDRVESDFDEDSLRAPYFVPYSEWKEFGRTRLYLTQEKMEKYVNHTKEPYMRGYPVKLSTIGTL